MGAATWAIPVGILAGICIVSFIFVWFWFPKKWQAGVRADMKRVDEENGGGRPAYIDEEDRQRNLAAIAERDRLKGIELRAKQKAAAEGKPYEAPEQPPPSYSAPPA